METIMKLFKEFHNNESGAVTVDWIVLAAAIVGLGMVVLTAVGSVEEEAPTTVAPSN